MVSTLGMFGFGRGIVYALRLDDTVFKKGMDGADKSMSRLGTTFLITTTAMSVGLGVVIGRFKEFQKEATLAAVIQSREAGLTDFNANLASIGKNARSLGEELKSPRTEMAALLKEVGRFGPVINGADRQVASISSRLGMLAETDAVKAAQIMVRLNNITGQMGATAEQTSGQIASVAGATFRLSSNITATGSEFLSLIQKMQVVGTVSNATAEEILAISAVIGDIAPEQRALATTAVTRFFTTEEFDQMGIILGRTAEGVKELRRNNPVQFLQEMAGALNVKQGEDSILSAFQELGLGGRRELKGTALLLSNIDRMNDFLEITGNRQQNANDLFTASGIVLSVLDDDLRGLRSAFGELGEAIGAGVAPMVTVLVRSLTELVNLLNQNRGTLAMLGIVGTLAGGKFIHGAAKDMLGGAMGQKLLGPLAGASLTTHAFKAAKAGQAAKTASNIGAIRGMGLAASGAGGIGGAFLKFFGMGGIGKKLTSTATLQMGRGVAARGALAAAGIGGPVGLIIGAAALLTPVFKNLGDMFSKLGERGGFLGLIFKNLANAFKVLQLVGNSINAVFTLLKKGFTAFFDWIKSLPVVGKMFEKLNTEFSKGGELLDKANKRLEEFNGTVSETAQDAPEVDESTAIRTNTQGGGGNTANVNVFVGDTGHASMSVINDAIRQAFGGGGASINSTVI